MLAGTCLQTVVNSGTSVMSTAATVMMWPAAGAAADRGQFLRLVLGALAQLQASIRSTSEPGLVLAFCALYLAQQGSMPKAKRGEVQRAGPLLAAALLSAASVAVRGVCTVVVFARGKAALFHYLSGLDVTTYSTREITLPIVSRRGTHTTAGASSHRYLSALPATLFMGRHELAVFHWSAEMSRDRDLHSISATFTYDGGFFLIGPSAKPPPGASSWVTSSFPTRRCRRRRARSARSSPAAGSPHRASHPRPDTSSTPPPGASPPLSTCTPRDRG